MNSSVPATSTWHKSSYSNGERACVEIAEGPITAVRDTQNRELGHVEFGIAEWHAFLADVRTDRF